MLDCGGDPPQTSRHSGKTVLPEVRQASPGPAFDKAVSPASARVVEQFAESFGKGN
jgi:hypothetical protein